ncbi:hypothetical protein [Ligilactobacillus ruminis]|uniref:hypothetical protein n=1 Tax=Ligilactobacillus ruminis TaxID=1623 RepID=UPI001475062B|nr:hypothetical protein [Ligilactobacillus ruminis]NME32544.1 hypothetical protein [Ligilactobacillus ruminis]
MKKLFSISMLIFLTISGMVVINKKIDDYFTKLLYGDKTEVSLLLKDDADCLELINSLKKISEGETSVSQYFFTLKGRECPHFSKRGCIASFEALSASFFLVHFKSDIIISA